MENKDANMMTLTIGILKQFTKIRIIKIKVFSPEN